MTDRVERWRRQTIVLAGAFACLSLAATVWGWDLPRAQSMNTLAAAIAVGTAMLAFGLLLAEFGAHRIYVDTYTFLYGFPFVLGRLVRDEHTAALVPLFFVATAAFSYTGPVPAVTDRLDPRWPFDRLAAKLARNRAPMAGTEDRRQQ
ncbi:MAG: hypothetical protein EAZ40_01565 [Rhodobacterales bacterium]|nr:MAG: hypothetical protein EAZ40_01565 [Rhodobacterales bacterium]